MKPNDVWETAIWLNGEETEEQVLQWMSQTIPEIVRQVEQEQNVLLGQLKFTIKRPGEERVPKVPDHISGIDVRLLVVEADVHPAAAKIEHQQSFVNDLTEEDKKRLRGITRKQLRNANPGHNINDKQCDVVIDQLGIDIITRTLRNGKFH